VEKRREDHEHEREHPPKTAPGRKLPKPTVPHFYIKTGLGFGWEERIPPER
jgi:hypothetical protein